MRIATLLLLLLPAVTTVRTVAQENPFPPVEKDGQVLLEGLKGVDDALLGEERWGIHLGAKNVGRIVLQVERATGEGVAYVTSMFMLSSFTAEPATQHDETLLDERLGRVRGRSVERRGAQVVKDESVRREGAEWVHERAEPAAPARRAPFTVADHGPLASMLLLARSLRDAPAGAYTLSRMDWATQPRARPLVVRVPAGTTEREHRGAKVAVRDVAIDVEGDDSVVFSVTPEGRVLAITIKDGPISMLAGTAAEVEADLPAAALPKVAGVADTPLAAVTVYLDVLTHRVPVDELDAVMDWTAIKDDLGDPDIAALPAASVAELLKSRTRQSPPVDPEEVAALIPVLQVTEEGDTARITMPQQTEDGFTLKRVDGKWWIIHFPH